MRKKVFITGGLLALFLLLSSSTAFAQSLKLSSDEVASIKMEINSGKPIKDVLKEHDITMDQIRSLLGSTGIGKEHVKLTNTQIANIASKLGLDAATVQSEINSGETLQQILAANHITADQIKTVLGTELQRIKPPKKGTKKTP